MRIRQAKKLIAKLCATDKQMREHTFNKAMKVLYRHTHLNSPEYWRLVYGGRRLESSVDSKCDQDFWD